MKKIVDWINDHKKLCILIVILFFIVPIITIIYLHYVIPSFFKSIGISADTLITYIAGFEAFIGTVYLGFVAARQSEKANDLNDRMIANAEVQHRFERQPSIMLTKITCEVLKPKENIMHFSIINASNAYTQLTTEKICFGDITTLLKNSDPKKEGVTQYAPILSLKPLEVIIISYKYQSDSLELDIDYPCTLHLRMQNSIGEVFLESISFKLKQIATNEFIVGRYSYKVSFIGNQDELPTSPSYYF